MIPIHSIDRIYTPAHEQSALEFRFQCASSFHRSGCVVRTISILISLLILTGLVKPDWTSAQQPASDEFQSENDAVSARPPVLQSKIGSFKKIPYKITKSELKELIPKPIDADKLDQLNAKLFYDGLVLGKVESVRITQNAEKLILNIGKDSRSCFQVVIDEKDYEKFGYRSAERIGSVYLRKTVLVSGLITQHQHLPQITVTLPYQLKVVSGGQ